jgi:hypothetical protein
MRQVHAQPKILQEKSESQPVLWQAEHREQPVIERFARID